MPAAARERQAVALGQSLRQAAGVIQLARGGRAARGAAPADLGPRSRRRSGSSPWPRRPTRPAAPVTTLTLADLRRFLECPLQGSVRVLLPMRDDDDAEDEAEAALRERENLGDARVQTLPLLRDLFGARARRRRHRRRRARGTLRRRDRGPAARRHAALRRVRRGPARAAPRRLLRSWREGLRAALDGRLPTGLAPIWYGAAPEHRRDIEIAPAIPLSVPLPEGARRVALHGQSEPLALVDGERMAVTLVDRRAARLSRTRSPARLADAPGARRPRAGAPTPVRGVVLAGRSRTASRRDVERAAFAPIGADDARALLAGLAAELLADVHAYLMPCEGVFTWKRRQRKGQAMTVREAVLLLRDDGVTRLSSEHGPVADARRYPVPADRDAEAYRRAPLRPLLRLPPGDRT